jgi:L-arabinokinase
VSVIAYYVSGHGFGHARRTVAVLRALECVAPRVRVIVRTHAPGMLFGGLRNATVEAPARAFDCGVVERDVLAVDPAATMDRLGTLLSQRRLIVADEQEFLRKCGARLVVADIPFLVGDAAQALGLPCVAVGNFTWDWIYEAYATSQTRPLVEAVRESYGRMRALLRLPFGHEVTCFGEVVDMPLLANQAELPVEWQVKRAHVLSAKRGGGSFEALRRVAADLPEYLFVAAQRPPAAPENLVAPPDADFSQIIFGCDAVVSKLGYGIVSDCIANKVALLFPPRIGFREDEIFRARCPPYMRMRELRARDFESGEWAEDLRALLNQPLPRANMTADGDRVIAGYLRQMLD